MANANGLVSVTVIVVVAPELLPPLDRRAPCRAYALFLVGLCRLFLPAGRTQPKGVAQVYRIPSRKAIQIQPSSQADRVFLGKTPGLRIVIPRPLIYLSRRLSLTEQ